MDRRKQIQDRLKEIEELRLNFTKEIYFLNEEEENLLEEIKQYPVPIIEFRKEK